MCPALFISSGKERTIGAEYQETMIGDPELKLTDKQLEAAYAEIHEDALYDNGRAGYSGTFAEKDDILIERGRVFGSEEEAGEYVEDVNDKWGPAHCVPVKDKGWYIGGRCSS